MDFSLFLKFTFWFDEISKKTFFSTSQARFNQSRAESLDITLGIISRLQVTTLKERIFSGQTWLKSLEKKATVCDRCKCRWNSVFFKSNAYRNLHFQGRKIKVWIQDSIGIEVYVLGYKGSRYWKTENVASLRAENPWSLRGLVKNALRFVWRSN
jgi:hypothetical protein